MPAKKKSIETTEIKCSSKLTYQLDNRTWYSFEESRTQSLNGLLNVEKAVEHYEGSVKLNYEANKFICSILLNS